MLAVVHPTTPTSASPTPPTATTSGSTASSSSSATMMQRKASAAGYRPAASSRTSSGSGSVHFQHQIPPSRTPSYHIPSASSSGGMPSNMGPATTSTPSHPRRVATPPPPPPPDPHSAPPPSQPPAFDISSYPPNDLLKLLASLLTQIAASNDSLSPTSSSSLHAIPSPQIHSPIWSTLTQASRTALSTPASTLTFHARNIPTISLESYFLRILKYCPTTNHVFLSLLVYFDRMAKLSLESTGRAFVIDSYNVHRLVIAGVTVASKFFSDVFYTNSRYAKVGGLPLPELNQLELQFLLLNDFRLVIRGDEMQRYAEQLILFSKSSSSGKEKEVLREGGEGAAVGSPHKPIPMQRRDSANAYSSFPSAAASHHTRSGSGGRSVSAQYHPPLASSTSSLPSRKRSTTPPASIPVAERRRSAEPQPTSRRTPPIHVNARQRVASYSDEEDDDSDDDYDSDDDSSRRRRANDTETETETETDAGETTDGGSGSTTSDEPTVRPTNVGRRTSMSTSSSFGDDDDDGEDDERARGMEVDAADAVAREVMIADGEGEGTPEVRRGQQHVTPRGEGPEYLEGDVRMGSPQVRR